MRRDVQPKPRVSTRRRRRSLSALTRSLGARLSVFLRYPLGDRLAWTRGAARSPVAASGGNPRATQLPAPSGAPQPWPGPPGCLPFRLPDATPTTRPPAVPPVRRRAPRRAAPPGSRLRRATGGLARAATTPAGLGNQRQGQRRTGAGGEAFPAIITRAQFQRVGRHLSSRAPKFSHPRRVGSSYLLSGLLKCKTCKTPLIGRFAQSGKYAYYVCQSTIKLGKDACKTPTLNVRRFEELVVAKIRSDILTEGNISELFKVVAEEMGGVSPRATQEASDH